STSAAVTDSAASSAAKSRFLDAQGRSAAPAGLGLFTKSPPMIGRSFALGSRHFRPLSIGPGYALEARPERPALLGPAAGRRVAEGHVGHAGVNQAGAAQDIAAGSARRPSPWIGQHRREACGLLARKGGGAFVEVIVRGLLGAVDARAPFDDVQIDLH